MLAFTKAMRAGETPRVVFLGASIKSGELHCEHFIIDDETPAGSLPITFVDEQFNKHDIVITWAEMLSSRQAIGAWEGDTFSIEAEGEQRE